MDDTIRRAELSAPKPVEAEDLELLALTAPPRGKRIATLTLMALVSATALALVFTLRLDLAFFFSNRNAIDLGAATALDSAALVSNSYATIRGTPMASSALRYRRDLAGLDYVAFPIAGQRTIYVEAPAAASGEGPLAETTFTGRLVRFGDLGSRAETIRDGLVRLGVSANDDSWLLLADERPGGSVGIVVLAALCVLVVLADLMLLLRWFKPLAV